MRAHHQVNVIIGQLLSWDISNFAYLSIHGFLIVHINLFMNQAMRSFVQIPTSPKVDWDTGHFFERGMEVKTKKPIKTLN